MLEEFLNETDFGLSEHFTAKGLSTAASSKFDSNQITAIANRRLTPDSGAIRKASAPQQYERKD